MVSYLNCTFKKKIFHADIRSLFHLDRYDTVCLHLPFSSCVLYAYTTHNNNTHSDVPIFILSQQTEVVCTILLWPFLDHDDHDDEIFMQINVFFI